MLKDFFQRNIVRDSFKLLTANVWAQGISFLAYLVLTRLFSKEEFALYNIFYSFIEIFIILSTCKYELSIVVADNHREASAIARLALRLNMAVSILLLLLILILHFFFPHFRYSPISSHLEICLLIPVMVFFCGTTRVFTHLFNRFRHYGQIAISEALTATSGVLMKILFGLGKGLPFLHSIGLPLGTVIGKMAGNINYLFRLRKIEFPADISPKEMRHVAQKHRNFPLYTMPKDLMNSFSYNLPFLWLALYFNQAEIGLFSLALTFTLRPINLFNNAFEKTLYVRITEKVRNGQPIRHDLFQFVKYLNLVALPLFLVAFLFAEPLFTFLFSGKWAGCGYYVRCLLPWVCVSLTSTSLMFISNVFGRQKKEFYFYVVLLFLRILSVLTGIYTHDIHLSILLFSLSGMVVSFGLLIWYFRLARNYEKTILA